MKSGKRRSSISRRQFIAGSALTGAAVALGCAGRKNSVYNFLSDDDASTLAAICDQVIPADDFPSASQAGVLTYIDRQLTRRYRRHQRTYLGGLKSVDRMSLDRFGLVPAAATKQQQLELVTALEKADKKFFELVRAHTMEGYYGSPRHGGNRDAVSWRMLGLTEPPLRGRAQADLTNGRQL